MVKITYRPTPRYQNPLAQKLGLGSDDLMREAKLYRLLTDLEGKIRTPLRANVTWRFNEAAETGALPRPTDWRDWPELTPRSVWGTTQKHTWLVTEISVPDAAAGGVLVLGVSSHWRPMQGSTDPQCLAYLDGEIAQALDGNHTELVIARDAVPGTRHLVEVNAFTFDERPMVGFESTLFLRNERVEALYQSLATAFDVAACLPQVDGRRHVVLDHVERALFALDRREGQEDAFLASLPAAEAIAQDIHALTRHDQEPTISAFGHAHLDVAWLWRIDHVRDKTARTFATVLNLMDEFPEFVFMYNQAVLFNFLKTDYPDLWARVKEKVASGQFDIEGAMWVEPDVNISSGEAIIRQIMRGRQFHIDAFGITPKSVWLPDTFGYSPALPQMFAKSGIDFFITSKLSWNDTDRHPCDSFFWRGIDGSRVKSHLITTQAMETDDHRTNYNSTLSVSDIMGTWKRYEPKAVNDDVMMCYGHGDGGGGPMRDMVQRAGAVARGIPGAPRLRMEGLRPFLERLGAKMDARADAFPVWNGELYLQYHRGTLTSVAKNKKNNRNAERAMRELEFAASMALLLRGRDYPLEAIRDLWDVVLIHQFHDILPGTSIAPVYADSDAAYGAFFATLDSSQGPMHAALDAVCPSVPGTVTLVNTTGQRRDGEMVEFPEPSDPTLGIATGSGAVPLQTIHRADGSRRAVAPVATLPAMGWTGLAVTQAPPTPATRLSVSPTHLENAEIALSFDAAGEITSIIDKTRARELVPPGQRANRMIAYEDKPKNYDAWDIDAYFEQKFWPLADAPATIEVIETGPHRAALRIARTYARSRIVQIVSLLNHGTEITFDTEVTWDERQTLLKTSFPFDLNVSETRAEIQFGHVKRASHKNTSWDRARFETSMQRWVDMSEPDFGAALLTDCKYGYDAVEQTLRLSLLKGPTVPDPDADRGVHRFRYALMLHGGEADLSRVVQAAERFNNPITVRGSIEATRERSEPAPDFSFAQLDTPNLTLETVKRAEDGAGIVLRIYEHANRRGAARLSFGLPVARLVETDMMETETITPHAIVENAVDLAFRPFEIKTLRVTFA